MNRFKQIIYEVKEQKNITREQFQIMMGTTSESEVELLYQLARETADSIYGKEVYIRGLIEFTNYCKNDCLYFPSCLCFLMDLLQMENCCLRRWMTVL